MIILVAAARRGAKNWCGSTQRLRVKIEGQSAATLTRTSESLRTFSDAEHFAKGRTHGLSMSPSPARYRTDAVGQRCLQSSVGSRGCLIGGFLEPVVEACWRWFWGLPPVGRRFWSLELSIPFERIVFSVSVVFRRGSSGVDDVNDVDDDDYVDDDDDDDVDLDVDPLLCF